MLTARWIAACLIIFWLLEKIFVAYAVSKIYKTKLSWIYTDQQYSKENVKWCITHEADSNKKKYYNHIWTLVS